MEIGGGGGGGEGTADWGRSGGGAAFSGDSWWLV